MVTPPDAVNAVALITAAGAGTRMGAGVKKEYRLLDGKPVLVYSLLAFMKTGAFSSIIVTVPPDDLASAPSLVSPYLDAGKIRFTAGGTTRQQSVMNGLHAAEKLPGDSIALIHDGARPWVTPALILRVLEAVKLHGAALPVLPAVYAMKTVDSDGFIGSHLDRTNLVSAQTPQGFRLAGILEAHRRAATDGYGGYDDTELFGRYIGRVFTVPGDPANVKITYPQDLETSR